MYVCARCVHVCVCVCVLTRCSAACVSPLDLLWHESHTSVTATLLHSSLSAEWLQSQSAVIKKKNSDVIFPHTAASLSFIGTCSNGVHLIFQRNLFVEYNFWWQHYNVQYTPVHTSCTNIDRMSCDCGVHGSNSDHSKLK